MFSLFSFLIQCALLEHYYGCIQLWGHQLALCIHRNTQSVRAKFLLFTDRSLFSSRLYDDLLAMLFFPSNPLYLSSLEPQTIQLLLFSPLSIGNHATLAYAVNLFFNAAFHGTTPPQPLSITARIHHPIMWRSIITSHFMAFGTCTRTSGLLPRGRTHALANPMILIFKDIHSGVLL